MRKKLGTRFPASRIKRIMQADEDVGKIAMAVPLLVSKALELFLQDLCDRTYEITLQRGAKTVNSFHLKQCVRSYSAFDFLTEVVNKVPDLGGTEEGGERVISRRRKTLNDGDVEISESRSAKAMRDINVGTRVRGRGRGRGRGRPPTRMIAESNRMAKFEDSSSISPEHDVNFGGPEVLSKGLPGNENIENSTSICAKLQDNGADTTPVSETKHNETSAWPLPDVMGGLGVRPSVLTQLTTNIDEDEDYDNED